MRSQRQRAQVQIKRRLPKTWASSRRHVVGQNAVSASFSSSTGAPSDEISNTDSYPDPSPAHISDEEKNEHSEFQRRHCLNLITYPQQNRLICLLHSPLEIKPLDGLIVRRSLPTRARRMSADATRLIVACVIALWEHSRLFNSKIHPTSATSSRTH